MVRPALSQPIIASMNISSHPALARALESELRASPITFKRFMELCLYHPEGGYYRQPAKRLGRDGDFKTSPHQSPIFGQILSRQSEEIWCAMGKPRLFNIYEYGAGEGWLAHDILKAAEESESSAFAQALAYTLIEQNPSSSARAGERLARWQEGKQAYPRARIEVPADKNFALPENFEGLIIAHEFLDALPVHILQQTEKGLFERYVERQDGKLSFRNGKLSEERLKHWFHDIGVELENGQTAEVCPAAIDWIESTAKRIRRGGILLFDYGFSSQALYHPSRREGTIRGYRDHAIIENPLDLPGETDLTAHVDFTSILKAAEISGLSLDGFTDQTHFLLGSGITEVLENEPENGDKAARERRRAMGLLDPRGLGGAIKVMLLTRRLDETEFPAFSMKPDDRESLATLRG
jgi:SAM-dependent MidA family methyltransferase